MLFDEQASAARFHSIAAAEGERKRLMSLDTATQRRIAMLRDRLADLDRHPLHLNELEKMLWGSA